MPKPNSYRPFQPDPSQLALKPDISGNTINGLGEETPRRPRMVYWAPDPDVIPHGRMQRWFYKANPDHPAMVQARENRARMASEEMPEVTGEPLQRAPHDWNAALDAYGKDGIFDMWGVAELDPLWVYEGHDVTQKRIVMLGFAHDYKEIATAPEPQAGAEVVYQYGRAMQAAKRVAGWLHL